MVLPAKIHPSVNEVTATICQFAHEVKLGYGQRNTQLIGAYGDVGLSINFVKPLEVPPWMTDKKVLPADRQMARIESFTNLVEMASQLSGIGEGYLTEPFKQLIESGMDNDYIAYYDSKETMGAIWICNKDLIVLIHPDVLKR